MFNFFFVTLPTKLQHYATRNKRHTTMDVSLAVAYLHTINSPDCG